ncbi:MAG TPA: hypothetical protein VG710_16335, partial [Opitutus sp.]|nr:hypothetical protein [Opitutus sp.]
DYRAAALALPRTATGRVPDKYGVGWAVASAPFYVIADGAVAGGDALGWWRLRRDGWNPVYQIGLQLGHAALALAALWLAAGAIVAWLRVDRATAWTGVTTVWAASPLLYYQTVDLSMAHNVAFFAVALLALALTRARGNPAAARWWWLAGAGWGLAVIARFETGVFGLLIAAAIFSRRPAQEPAGAAMENPSASAAGRGRFIGPAVLCAIGAAPFVAVQLVAWRIVYGRWLVFGYGAEGEAFHWAKPNLWNSWFSPWHGLFYWHPFLLAGLAGLIAWAWRARGAALVLAAIFAITWYVNSAWWCWWFASSFGNRAYDAALLPLMAGTAWLFASARNRWGPVLWGAALTAAAWNFYLVLLYRTAAIPHNAPVTWWRMLEAGSLLPAAMHF